MVIYTTNSEDCLVITRESIVKSARYIESDAEVKLAEKLKTSICIYCGKESHLSRKCKSDPQKATLDRIDNGNIIGAEICQWICFRCNIDKSDMPDGLYRIFLDFKRGGKKDRLIQFVNAWYKSNISSEPDKIQLYLGDIISRLSRPNTVVCRIEFDALVIDILGVFLQ
jgi:hypothetical protein